MSLLQLFFIAFTYKRKGALVSCKYRDVNKRFWQEQNTEKIFYGLDDIKNASDIIIVEGEIDKLSIEEAGFLNCVSVPNGAPPQVSTKDVPSPEKLCDVNGSLLVCVPQAVLSGGFSGFGVEPEQLGENMVSSEWIPQNLSSIASNELSLRLLAYSGIQNQFKIKN